MLEAIKNFLNVTFTIVNLAYLNTVLLFIVIVILIVILFKKKNNSILKEELLPNKRLPISQSEPSLEITPSQPKAVTNEPNDDAFIRELFEVEEVPAEKIIVRDRESDITDMSLCAQIFGEFIKGNGNYTRVGAIFRVRFKPEVERGLRNGTYTLMSRSNGGHQLTAIDSLDKSKIISNGWVENVHAERLIALSTIVWQAMSIVTAQKFLSDINNTLKDIKTLIDDLKSLHYSDIYGKLNGWQQYIKQSAERLAGNINETERQAIATQLEMVNRLSIDEYSASKERLERSIKDLIDAMKNKKANEETDQEVYVKCANIKREADILFGFARINVVNMVAMNMRLDFRPEIGLNFDHALLKESEGVLNGLGEALRTAILLSDSPPWYLWYSKNKYIQIREDIKRKIDSLISKLKEQQENQLQLISKVQSRLEKSQDLYFQVDKNGQIKQVECDR